MGQDQSQQNNNYSFTQEHIPEKPSWEIEGALEYIKKVQNDPVYGEYKLMKHNESQTRLAIKSFFVSSDKDFQKIYDKANQLYQLQQKTQYMVKLIQLGKDTQEDMCSKYINTMLVFEYLKDNLLKKIIYRKKHHQKFREIDIYFLINCVINALKAMDSIGLSHGDLSPQTILLGNDGNYQISEINFMAGQNAYRNFLLGGKGSCYLSPDLLISLKQRELNPEHNPRLSDIFALGMICLEMCTLSNINTCYNFQEFSLNYENIQDLLNQVSENYSDQLALIIAGMIDVQEHKRYDIDEIIDILSQIQDQLKDVQCSPIKTQYEPLSSEILENTKRYKKPDLTNSQQQKQNHILDSQPINHTESHHNVDAQPYLQFEHINLETEEKQENLQQLKPQQQLLNQKPINSSQKAREFFEEDDGDYNEGVEEDVEYNYYHQQQQQSQQKPLQSQQFQFPTSSQQKMQSPVYTQQYSENYQSPDKQPHQQMFSNGKQRNNNNLNDYSENFDIPNEDDTVEVQDSHQKPLTPLNYRNTPPNYKHTQKLSSKKLDNFSSHKKNFDQTNVSPIQANNISPITEQSNASRSPQKQLSFADKYKQKLNHQTLNSEYDQYQQQKQQQQQNHLKQPLGNATQDIADLQQIIFNGLQILDQKVSQVIKDSNDIRQSQYRQSISHHQSYMQNKQSFNQTQQSYMSPEKQQQQQQQNSLSLDNNDILQKIDHVKQRRNNSIYNLHQSPPNPNQNNKQQKISEVNKYIAQQQQQNDQKKQSQESLGSANLQQNILDTNNQQQLNNNNENISSNSIQKHQQLQQQQQQPASQQESSRVLDSNSLYDLYMQEYSRLKKQKTNQ